jgi:hypothetical protein
MMLPFTHDAFVEVFRIYNQAIWPAQVGAYLLGALTVLAALRPGQPRIGSFSRYSPRCGSGPGSSTTGCSSARSTAPLSPSGSASFCRAACSSVSPLGRATPRFAARRDGTSLLGLALVTYAMLLYPLVRALAGQVYPGIPVFGVAPCPVVVFTFGMLLMAERPVPVWLLVLPGLWSLIGGSAAFLLAVPQDWLLLLSGMVSVPLILRKGRKCLLPDGQGLTFPPRRQALSSRPAADPPAGGAGCR